MATPTAAARRRLDSDTPVIALISSDSGDSGKSTIDNSKFSSRAQRALLREFQKWQRRIPWIKKLADVFYRIPPRLRLACLLAWVLWKFIIAFIFLRILWTKAPWNWHDGSLSSTTKTGLYLNPPGGVYSKPIKILYMVTTLAEYNTGARKTLRGQDRLREILLPTLVDSVESLISPPFLYEVDVYLILGYSLRPERKQMIIDQLPDGVGLQVWDNSTPLGYDKAYNKEKLVLNTRALSRQHRYVVRDKLYHYDFFMAFEDDMRVTGHHVQHFLQMSIELDRLRNEAPKMVPDVPENMDPKKMKFFGQMTEAQMQRLVPGFIRVEVLLNETAHGAQLELDPIPLDYEFSVEGKQQERHIDPSICCHVPNMKPNPDKPKRPKASDVIIWETNIKALSVRQLQGSSMLDWVVLLPGPGKKMKQDELIGGYWSGRDGAFGDEKKPTPGMPDLIAQQGGWMATRDQINRMNSGLCMGAFLPPFDQPVYYEDGQQSVNVEFWSGGYQFFTGVRGGCNMQRLVSLHPDHFSKHLIYHVANNKQKQLSRDRMLRADHLFAQLNTVKKTAEKTMATIKARIDA